MTTATLPIADRMALLRAKRAEKQAQGRQVPVSPQNANSPSAAQQINPILQSLDGAWTELASAKGIRLPQRKVSCTPARMSIWLRRLGFSIEWYKQYTGFTTLQQWIDANPQWPLRAFCGLLLEELQ